MIAYWLLHRLRRQLEERLDLVEWKAAAGRSRQQRIREELAELTRRVDRLEKAQAEAEAQAQRLADQETTAVAKAVERTEAPAHQVDLETVVVTPGRPVERLRVLQLVDDATNE